MRVRTLGVIAGLAALGPAAGASAAGDPIMPLSQVQSGMRCTGYSVFRGQQIEPFDVEILDVVGQAANGAAQPRLLVRVSGERVDVTGVGPGFSGSPVYCPAGDGTMQNAGAISETIGDYGGKTVLATPIEQILGTPVDPPRAAEDRPTPPAAGRRRDARLLARARPLAAPITVGGVGPSLMRGLAGAAQRRGIMLLAAPPVPADASPVLPMQPGSAAAVGLSSGDISISAVGTVAYVDGASVWTFGHPLDSAGERALLLQDAYVATIVNNPIQVEAAITYKLSGPVHDRGTITNDAFDAVAGRIGGLPPLTRVRVFAEDRDRHLQAETEVAVADETDVGNPSGFSALDFIGPIAVGQGATDVLGAAPQRVAGRMCFAVVLRERKQPLRFCNRYVSDGVSFGESVGANPLALSAGSDVAAALGLFDGYKGKPVHIVEATARVTQTRAQRQGYLRSVTLPRRVRRGATVPAKIVFRVVRGERRTVRFRWRVPRSLRPGRRTIRLRGSDPEFGGGDFFDFITIDLSGEEEFFDTEGPRSIEELAKQFRGVRRWDGIRQKSGKRFYRDDKYRIGGAVKTTVRVLERRR